MYVYVVCMGANFVAIAALARHNYIHRDAEVNQTKFSNKLAQHSLLGEEHVPLRISNVLMSFCCLFAPPNQQILAKRR
jgi:hypothetical protein